jgi:hypothetical protein
LILATNLDTDEVVRHDIAHGEHTLEVGLRS